MKKKAIWWIKRDFRVLDNEAFCAAVQENDEVLPVFVFEPQLIQQPDYSAFHVWAWITALTDLQKRLRKQNGDVLIVRENIGTVLETLHKKWNFQTIYSHEETGNHWTFDRDRFVQKWCKKKQIQWKEYTQTGVIRALSSRDDRSPIIKKRLFETAPFPAPKNIKFPLVFRSICQQKKIPSIAELFEQHNYSKINFKQTQIVSETSAHQTLQSFLQQRAQGYSGGISSPNKAFVSGSRLSPHLAWGTISLRFVFQATFQAIKQHENAPNNTQWKRSLNAFMSRLHWHDHFIQRLESAPWMEFRSLNKAYHHLPYTNNTSYLQAWLTGQTGVPIIDACMRCLQATGFLNFRMRAMVVSFACFSLHLDWQYIHPHLAQIFLDYEPGIHISQLQMQAGVVGINTIRVYSPTKQMIDQDPQCVFIKKWVPELRPFTAAEIINYEKVSLAPYPQPIVNTHAQSKHMKDVLFRIRKSLFGQQESQKVLTKHGSRKKTQRTKKSVPKQPTLF